MSETSSDWQRTTIDSAQAAAHPETAQAVARIKALRQTIDNIDSAVIALLAEHDMYNTFNMGVGMAVIVPAEYADEALAVLKENGEDAYFMGEVAQGAEKGVVLC